VPSFGVGVAMEKEDGVKRVAVAATPTLTTTPTLTAPLPAPERK